VAEVGDGVDEWAEAGDTSGGRGKVGCMSGDRSTWKS